MSISTALSTMLAQKRETGLGHTGPTITSRALRAILPALLGMYKNALQIKRRKMGVTHFAMNTTSLSYHFFHVALNNLIHRRLNRTCLLKLESLREVWVSSGLPWGQGY